MNNGLAMHQPQPEVVLVAAQGVPTVSHPLGVPPGMVMTAAPIPGFSGAVEAN
jgi:hypothetical protein